MSGSRLALASLCCVLFLASINRQSSAEDLEKGIPPAKSANLIRLILPPVIHAVPGIEANIYFDNICLTVNPRNYAFDVHCSRGKQQDERWTFTAAETDVGDHLLTIDVRNEQNQIVAQAKTIVRVVPAKSGDGQAMSLLCIGDSLTHASVYPDRILAMCAAAGNPKLELIGSHWVGTTPGPVRHEGYGGWTALRFATHFTEMARSGEYSKRGSPFLYAQPDGKPKLDFLRYCQDVNAGKTPSHVTIFLGPNDIFSYDDTTIEAGIDKMLSHFDQIVEMIRSASPMTRLGVMLPVPPAATQDAFGSNYTSGQTRWQYKRNQHRLVERMVEKYSTRESDRIELISTYVGLDCANNYPIEKVVANARSTTTITRQNNGVHPSESGYGQIADSVYAWLKSTSKNER
ncbi:MAG: hypothetical protein JWM11_6137 [Planctomycetaceae bacterium]|nr:hypothetical protein [Planctomycetaceae bacterium]